MTRAKKAQAPPVKRRKSAAENETFTPFDAADFLRDEKDIAAFLEAAAEDGNPEEMARALGTVARARNMTNVAREAGLTREGLYKALSGHGNPSFATIVAVARALGVKLAFTRA